MALGQLDGQVSVFNFREQKFLQQGNQFSGHKGSINEIVVLENHDKIQFATASDDEQILIWQLADENFISLKVRIPVEN
jgi:hypothetical protein